MVIKNKIVLEELCGCCKAFMISAIGITLMEKLSILQRLNGFELLVLGEVYG